MSSPFTVLRKHALKLKWGSVGYSFPALSFQSSVHRSLRPVQEILSRWGDSARHEQPISDAPNRQPHADLEVDEASGPEGILEALLKNLNANEGVA